MLAKQFKNKAKEQESWFLAMVLGTLGASLLENLVTDKGTSKAVKEQLELVKPPHPLTNVEIQKYYRNETKFKRWDVCNKSNKS